MLVVPKSGMEAMLQLIVRSGLTLTLFANDVQPGPDDTAATYQEPVGGGYAPIQIPPKAWKVKNGIAFCPEQTFLFTGATRPNVIYGYAVKVGNTVLWAERLPEPFPVAIKGDRLLVIPTLAAKLVLE